MLTVGLTGGIACGKSTVAGLLRGRGVPVLDLDQVAREVVAPGTPGFDAVAARWPSVVVRDDHGRPGLDRGAIRAIVLDDPAELAALNAIVHPRVWEAAEAWMEAREDEGAPAVVVEAALMVETGSWRRYDRLLVVTCADAVQRARLAARNGFDAETVEKAIAAQLPNAAKEACADELIRNDGDQAALAVATAAAWERILATPSTIPKVPGA